MVRILQIEEENKCDSHTFLSICAKNPLRLQKDAQVLEEET